MKSTALKMSAALTFVVSRLLMPDLCLAQDNQSEKAAPNHQGWYQVEMIIFSRNNPSLQEHFPTNIHLGYPSRWQVLKDPNPIASRSVTENNSITNQPAVLTSVVDLNTQPFYMLPAESRQLNSAADKLSRSSDFTILFHQAWRQPITAQSQADWILINNQRSDEHAPLLSGSIRLSVATYLRLETRLWFAEFEPKLDDTAKEWPEIPESPDKIVQEIDATQSSFFSDENQNTPEQTEATTDQWQTKQIVLLKDRREMRSNEAHYIDHPLVGMIIKISPFNPNSTTDPINLP
jgi:Peptidoglycan-binding protein, CsiV